VIFGTGGFSELVAVYLTEDSEYEVAAFTVEEQYMAEGEYLGRKVIPFETVERTYPPADFSLFVAVGHVGFNEVRTRIYHECKRKGYDFINYISSQAVYWSSAGIGENSFICESSVIQPGVRIGSNVIIRSACNIGHHTTIGDHCFIASGATIAGKCIIESGSFIGVNATVSDRRRVAPNSIVGAGALILQDTVENGVYKGNETLCTGTRRARS
jgi:sugar O-acyltransferase (sialic acid O-acetyltransferase NeuD family)